MRTPNRHHRGAVVFELILVLPILVIAIFAAVEFALLLQNKQQLEMAARAGAEVASQMTLPETGPLPVEILTAVDRVLTNAGIQYGRVSLEHDVDTVFPGSPPFVLTAGSPPCPIPITPSSPPVPIFGSTKYVRVTVCTEGTQLAPDCLAIFGFTLVGRVMEATVTLRYEESIP